MSMAAHDAPLEELGRRFRSLAEVDCRGYSPLYERLSLAIADDVELLELLARARPGQRRPTLLLAAVNYLGGMGEFEAFREFALEHRDDVLHVVETRATQTNEVGRCAVLLPAFLRATEPLAIVEVGASAGLNLLFDRYGYDYGTARIGDASPCLECDSYLVPDHVPEVAWRIGLDREPVDVRDDDAIAWLRACVWADQMSRIAQFDAAVAGARRNPPTIVRGDAINDLEDVIAQVPLDAHLVIWHTMVVTYFLRDERPSFFQLLSDIGRQRDLTWISGEAPGVVPDLGLDRGDNMAMGVVSFRDGEKHTDVLGIAHPHGSWLRPPG